MKKYFALLFLFSASAFAQVPTGTFVANPATGTGSVTSLLSWNISGADSCTASGGWTGAKAVSGTQSVTVTATTTYTLTCSGAVTNGSALLSWTAPTQNTDGSALTDLAGYKVYRGTSSGAVTTLVTSLTAPAASYTVTGLTSGTHWFSVTAFNTAGNESAKATPGSKTIPAAQSATFSATITVNKVPAPPGNFTVSNATVYEVRRRHAWRVVGTIQLGTACYPDVYQNGRFMAVMDSDVKFDKAYRGGQLVAECASA